MKTMMIKELIRIFILMHIFLWVGTVRAEPTKDLNHLPERWNHVHIRPYFYDNVKENGSSILLWRNKNGSSEDFDNILKPVPNSLKYQLFAKKTVNPFRSVFADFYTKASQKKFQLCDFVGIQFELDDNKKTKEWYIAAAAEVCIYGDNAIRRVYAGGSSDIHSWILQQDNRGRYRVLIESEGTISIGNNRNMGYREIKESYIYNKHVYRKRNKQNPASVCGGGTLKWQYQNDQYLPVKMYPSINSCSRYYDDFLSPETKAEFDARMAQLVSQNVLNWLEKVRGEKLTVDRDGNLLPMSPQTSSPLKKQFDDNEVKAIKKLLDF